MKHYLISILIFLFYCLSSKTQPQYQALNKADFTTGIYYYPEFWPETEWERDIANIKKLGFEFIHIADFSWAVIEPKEGEYNFAWMDKVLSLSHKYQLKVILTTPTAAAPIWVSRNYPETLVKTPWETFINHGTRAHSSFSSTKFKELGKKIAAEMAKRYGNDKRVWGWQVDNEPSHAGIIDYSNAAEKAFREWLKNKYKTIDNLNEAWAAKFWSLKYDNFEQILPPNPKNSWNHLGLTNWVDWVNFSSDETISFLKIQTDEIRKYAKNQFVTTNLIAAFEGTDSRACRFFDISSFTLYPVVGNIYPAMENAPEPSLFREKTGNPQLLTLSANLYRAVTPSLKFGIMELQPGQINSGKFNPIPYPNFLRAELWSAFASGASFVASYRYRQPNSGSEMYHWGIIEPDGLTPNQAAKEYEQFNKEYKALIKNTNKEYANKPKEIAFLFEHKNWWAQNKMPQTNQWDFYNFVAKFHSSFLAIGKQVDFISEEVDFEQYKVIALPAYQIMNQTLINKLTQFMNKGGTVIATVRTAQMNENLHLWKDGFSSPIMKWTNTKIDGFDVLGSQQKSEFQYNNKEYYWNNWLDLVRPLGAKKSLNFKDSIYAKYQAVVNNKVGKGNFVYIAVDAEQNEFYNEVLKESLQLANVKTYQLPKEVYRYERGDWKIYINMSEQKVSLPIEAHKKIHLGSFELKPLEVLIIE